MVLYMRVWLCGFQPLYLPRYHRYSGAALSWYYACVCGCVVFSPFIYPGIIDIQVPHFPGIIHACVVVWFSAPLSTQVSYIFRCRTFLVLYMRVWLCGFQPLYLPRYYRYSGAALSWYYACVCGYVVFSRFIYPGTIDIQVPHFPGIMHACVVVWFSAPLSTHVS